MVPKCSGVDRIDSLEVAEIFEEDLYFTVRAIMMTESGTRTVVLTTLPSSEPLASTTFLRFLNACVACNGVV
jgi:hypothetical protein